MKVLCLCLLIALGVVLYANKPEPQITLFDAACAKVEADFGTGCGDLAPPTVVVSRVVNIVGNLTGSAIDGVHVPPEGYIFISPDATSPVATELHETLHYIVRQTGVNVGDMCSEEIYIRKITKQPWGKAHRAYYKCAN